MDIINAAGMDETYDAHVDDEYFDTHGYDVDTDHDTDDDTDDDTGDDDVVGDAGYDYDYESGVCSFVTPIFRYHPHGTSNHGGKR